MSDGLPTTLKDLIEARKFIEKGWTRIGLSLPTGEVCAYGAIMMAVNGKISCNNMDRLKKASNLLVQTLSKKKPVLLHHWHSAPERSKKDVLELFDTTIMNLARIHGIALTEEKELEHV